MSAYVLGVDTNILVRFFVRDDERQYQLAEALIEAAPNGGLFVDPLVMVELNWVLTSAYRYDRKDVFSVLEGLTEFKQFTIGRRTEVLEALFLAEDTGADFSDALISLLSSAAGCTRTATFDRKAQRLPQMISVEKALV